MSTAGCDTSQSASAATRDTATPPPRIAIVGVGSAGCAAATRAAAAADPRPPLTLIDARLPDAPIVPAIARFLARRRRATHIPLIQQGERTPFCTIPPAWFHDAALRRSDEIGARLRDYDVVVLVAALGGNAGSGAMPVVAAIARECAATAIAVVSMPFGFEGRRRSRRAGEALAGIGDAAHMTIAIRADDLLRIDPREPITSTAAYGLLDGRTDTACETLLDLLGVGPDNTAGVPLRALRALLANGRRAAFVTGRGRVATTAAVEAVAELRRLQPALHDRPCTVIAQVRGSDALSGDEVTAARLVLRQRFANGTRLLMDAWQESPRPDVEVRLIVEPSLDSERLAAMTNATP